MLGYVTLRYVTLCYVTLLLWFLNIEFYFM